MRVFLLDDHEIVRHGLIAVINAEPDLEVVGEAGTVAETLKVVGECNPDVAGVDVCGGGGARGGGHREDGAPG